ncbi:MAG: glycosyltransferase family 2 protein [Bacteroidia bacterium]
MVYILIVNHNNWHDTASCVQSLLNSHFNKFRIVIINNGENRPVADALPSARIFTNTEFNDSPVHEWETLNIVNTSNRGYGAAVNLVLPKISSEKGYAWLLNPDIMVEPETLAALMACAERSTGKVIFGCKVYSATTPAALLYLGGYRLNAWSGTIRFIRNEAQENELFAISGGCLFAATAAFAEVGLFPEDYFIYWEDTEWCYQARLQQYRLQVCHKAICYDKGSTTIGKGYLADYFYSYNGLRFLHRFYPWALPLAMAANCGRIIKRLAGGKLKNARAILLSTFHFITGRKPNADRLLAHRK